MRALPERISYIAEHYIMSRTTMSKMRRHLAYLSAATLLATGIAFLAASALAQSGPYSDNFNRGDGPLGPNWAKPLASEGNLVVVTNVVSVDAENKNDYAFWAANTFADDQYSQISITKIGAWPGVIVRADAALDRFYLGLLVAPNDYRIYARWDGAYYLLASDTKVTWQVGDVLRMDSKGSVNPLTVTMYRNGSAVLAWTSSVPAQVRTGGSPGIGIFSPAGQGLTLDNWQGGNLAPDTQPPTAPASLTATAPSSSQINLIWAASTDNVGVTGYLIERQNPGSASFTQIGTALGTSYSDSGLGIGTSYSYRVRATDAAGNLSPYSPVATATTQAPDTQPPTAPGSPVALAVGGSQIELNWNASTDNVGVTGYLVERQDPTSGVFAQVGTTASTSYVDTGLAGTTSYIYRVRATDAAGNLSPYSPTVSATTLAAAVASDNFNRPNGSLGPNWSKPMVSVDNLVVVNNQVGVDVENNHNYAYWSTNSFSNDQYSQVTITKVGPWTGVILRADPVQDRFYMGFVFGTNDYRIYSRWDGAYYSLSTGSAVSWQAGDVLRLEVRGSVDPITITMYRNGAQVLSWVSTGSGQIKASGSPGMGIYSPSGMGLTIDNWEGGNLPPDTQPPTAPASLTATAVSGSEINLSWTPSTDNIGVTGYLVERQSPGSTSFTQIGTATGNQYNDTGLAANTNYSYRVRATDAAGNLSPYSPLASATTLTGGGGFPFSDNFNRANGALGPNWSKPMASEGNLVIVGSQVGVDSENKNDFAFWSANGFNDNQYSQISITKIGAWSGVILRADGILDRFYLGLLVAPNDYRIYARWDGSYYLLASATTETWQVGDILRMEITGSVNPATLTMYRNGAPVLSWTTSVPAQVRTGGGPGIGIFSSTGQGITLDNWQGGNL